MQSDRERQIRALFDDYIRLYAARDPRLTELFSEDFTGYTGGGDVLVRDRQAWSRITLQDFAEVASPIRIEMLDLALQDLCETVVVCTAFFHICLPLEDHVLSREVARLVLIFRLEGEHWRIVHSGISIPYHLVQEGEVYPLAGLKKRNSELEAQVNARTRELQESAALYRLLTEDTLDVIWKVDRNLIVTYISPADQRLRGYAAHEVVGRHVFEMFTDEGAAVVEDLLRRRMSNELPPMRSGFISFEAQHRCKDGRLLWGEVMSKAELDAQGAVTGYHGITREITERKRLEEQVRQLAFHDALTGLPNRRLLQDRLEQAMAANRRGGAYGALMFLDLDNFKSLNDSHGHEMGDDLLLQAAARLKRCVRATDTVARFGGDEFVVLLPRLNAERGHAAEQAVVVARKILQCLGEPYRLRTGREGVPGLHEEHRCTASIGISLFNGSDADLAQVLKEADKAMYQAKDAGRDTACIAGAAPAA